MLLAVLFSVSIELILGHLLFSVSIELILGHLPGLGPDWILAALRSGSGLGPDWIMRPGSGLGPL